MYTHTHIYTRVASLERERERGSTLKSKRVRRLQFTTRARHSKVFLSKTCQTLVSQGRKGAVECNPLLSIYIYIHKKRCVPPEADVARLHYFPTLSDEYTHLSILIFSGENLTFHGNCHYTRYGVSSIRLGVLFCQLVTLYFSPFITLRVCASNSIQYMYEIESERKKRRFQNKHQIMHI